MKRIGIYGGTFDPIHLGHMAAARAAARELQLDKLLLIPDGDPPHKSRSPAGADGENRLSCVQIAADRLGPDIEVEASDIELRRSGKSYTCDTLKILREQYPKAELWLLMGTDMFLTLQEWKSPEFICSAAHICAFARERADRSAQFARQKAFLEQKYGADVRIIEIPDLIEISSTQIRAALSAGERPKELDESVYGAILRLGLYGTHANLTRLGWEDLRAVSYSMIRRKRIAHVRGVEDTAVFLAKQWGENPDAARAAGILHDCTKYFSRSRHLAVAERYHVTLDEQERVSEKLLHAKTGAAIARQVFGMPDCVVEAIRWHTTGRAGMTLLEKILYIADYTEPTRDFEGVERLRSVLEEDLDAAVILGLEMSIEEISDRGDPVHKDTMEALDFLRKENCNG